MTAYKLIYTIYEAHDRVKELELALRGLLDCISETRGSPAYKAVEEAHRVLGKQPTGDVTK